MLHQNMVDVKRCYRFTFPVVQLETSPPLPLMQKTCILADEISQRKLSAQR